MPIGFGRSCNLSLQILGELCKSHVGLAAASDISIYLANDDELSILAKAIPAGARWITVHPNGKDAKGVPVLIQETKRGSGVFHVIGGAGGKLNYLKLKGVKSHGEYKQQAAEKQKARRESAKAQRAAGAGEGSGHLSVQAKGPSVDCCPAQRA